MKDKLNMFLSLCEDNICDLGGELESKDGDVGYTPIIYENTIRRFTDVNKHDVYINPAIQIVFYKYKKYPGYEESKKDVIRSFNKVYSEIKMTLLYLKDAEEDAEFKSGLKDKGLASEKESALSSDKFKDMPKND